jgi:tetratricopeptide (TPR) repeat protein
MRWFVIGLVVAVLSAAAPRLRAEEPAAPADPSADALNVKLAQMAEAAKLNPQDARAQYELGNAYYDAGKLQEAIKAYEQAVAADSTQKEALVNLGNAYNESGKLQEAVSTFERALRVDPRDDKALSNLGNSYYALGQYDDGMKAYKRALEVNPKCFQAHYNIGVAFADAGIFREAVREWLKVIELAPPGTPDAESAKENVKVIEKMLGEKYLDGSKGPQEGGHAHGSGGQGAQGGSH